MPGQLLLQVSDQALEPIGGADALEQLLAHFGRADEHGADEVCHNVRIFQVQCVAENGGHGVGAGDPCGGIVGLGQCGGWWKGESEFEVAFDELAELLEEEAGFFGRGGLAGQGYDALEAVGFVTERVAEGNARESLKDQVGGAVAVLDGHADQSEPCDVVGDLACAGGLLHGHHEQPVGLQYVYEHLTVARFEDVNGQQRLGEQGRRGQGHYRCFAGHDHRVNLEGDPPGARGRGPRRTVRHCQPVGVAKE